MVARHKGRLLRESTKQKGRRLPEEPLLGCDTPHPLKGGKERSQLSHQDQPQEREVKWGLY